jgi:hypothetical protein
MENGVVKGGNKGYSQGIEGSANANDVWVWMDATHHLSFFLLIEFLSGACKFHKPFLFFF